ncbi:MAG: hypothetical protein NT062_00440, partial [Proteobacteria bacterium]|nr:hypothetical protein [Pseudomonadota bacterium]
MIVTTAAFVVLISYSWDYYALPWEARFDAPHHRELRPSGSIGHLYGNIGIVLILGNLLYLVRRRLVNISWLGSMRGWMDWHVVSGIVGPSFVLVHSAFTLRTWPAIVSAASLAVVVVTGIFGRYLYRLVPRVGSGRQQSEELAADVDRSVMALRKLGPGAIEAGDRVELDVASAIGRVGNHTTGFGAILGALGVLWRLRRLRANARDVALAAGATRAHAIAIGRA